jgi:hypothetical protein
LYQLKLFAKPLPAHWQFAEKILTNVAVATGELLKQTADPAAINTKYLQRFATEI